MARAAALLLAGALGAVLCAAIHSETVEEIATTTEGSSEQATKLPREISKQFLDKLTYDLEPSFSHGFPYPLSLPPPWIEKLKHSKEQPENERDNAIVWKNAESNSAFADAASGDKSEDLVVLASRMMEEEAERRRRFKKKMQALVRSRLPKAESGEVIARMPEEPENITEEGAKPARRGGEMMGDIMGNMMFRAFSRMSHIMPLVQAMFASQDSRPFSSLSGRFAPTRRVSTIKIERPESDGMMIMKGFSFGGIGGDTPMEDDQRRKIDPDESTRIDVRFVPLRSRLLSRLILIRPTLDFERSAPSGTEDSDDVEIIPGNSAIFSRFLNDMHDRTEKKADDNFEAPSSTNETHTDPEKNAPEKLIILPQQSPIPAPAESVDTDPLKLKMNLEKKLESYYSKLQKFPAVDSPKIPPELKTTRRKREIDSSTTEGETSTESSSAPKARILDDGDETTTAQPTNRMFMPEVAPVPAPAMNMIPAMGMMPHMMMKYHMMKPYMKMMPFFGGVNPMMYEKMAHHMKMFPKYAMMMGGHHMGMGTPMGQHMLAMNDLATAEAAAQTSAVAADAATAHTASAGMMANAAGPMMHPMANPMMAMGGMPCGAPCMMWGRRRMGIGARSAGGEATARSERIERSERRKRSVRSGSDSSSHQTFQSSEVPSDELDIDKELNKQRPTSETPTFIRGFRERQMDPPMGQFPPFFRPQKSLFQRERVEWDPLRTFPTPKALPFPQTSEAAKQKPFPGAGPAMMGQDIFPMMREGIPTARVLNEGSMNGELPGIFTGSSDEMKPVKLKEFWQGPVVVEKKKRKKVLPMATFPETLEAGKPSPELSPSSGERWPPSGGAAYGVFPYISRMPSLLSDGERSPADERPFYRGPRSVPSTEELAGRKLQGEATAAEAALRSAVRGKGAHHGGGGGAGGSEARRRAAKARARNRALGKAKAKAARKAEENAENIRVKRIRPDRMPFLDPSMMDEGHDDHFHRREMNNDFAKLSSFDH